MEWCPAGWSVFLPLLIFPCTIKSRSSLLAPALLCGPGKRAVKWLWWSWIFKRKSFELLNIRCFIYRNTTRDCVTCCFGRSNLPRESFLTMLGKIHLSSSSRLLKRIHQSFLRDCTVMILTASSPVGTFVIMLCCERFSILLPQFPSVL